MRFGTENYTEEGILVRDIENRLKILLERRKEVFFLKTRFFIPLNFALEGTVRGMFKIRNVIEALIIALGIGYPVIKFLPISLKAKIYTLVILILPAAVVALLGINGLSLSEFIIAFATFQANKRILKAPSSKDKIERQKNLIKKKRKKIQEQQKMERREKAAELKQMRIENFGFMKEKDSDE